MLLLCKNVMYHYTGYVVSIWYRVTKVTERDVEVFDKKTGKTTTYPTGLVIWATGIAPLPLTKEICKSLPEQCNK